MLQKLMLHACLIGDETEQVVDILNIGTCWLASQNLESHGDVTVPRDWHNLYISGDNRHVQKSVEVT